MSIFDGFLGLGSKVNKAKKGSDGYDMEEGAISDPLPELRLDMDNEELVELTESWEKEWEESEVRNNFLEDGRTNFAYWKGDHFEQPNISDYRPQQDNVIFEALETWLPRSIKKNPDPMVTVSRKEKQTKENVTYALELQKKIAEDGEEGVLRLKLRKMARHWSIFKVGIAKLSWDTVSDIPQTKIVLPPKIILDPKATIDEDGYTGDRIGERRDMLASELIAIMELVGAEEDAVKYIKEEIAIDKEKEYAPGTTVQFIEWWTDEYMCWKLRKKILIKKKNPHWNEKTEGVVTNVNHFNAPQKPYVFLSVFNVGMQPVDDCSLIGQNLSSQDKINKRIVQIDKNIDNMNGAIVVSGERTGLNKSQAHAIVRAGRDGGVVYTPIGSASEAIAFVGAGSLPADVYNELNDSRIRVRDIFGTRGSSAAGLESERTVRGKIQNSVLDTDRIGGGFSEYLEQVADKIYNWYVQLLYVYDTDYKNASQGRPVVRVNVKEGSLLPKDSVTIANQAMELAAQNKMSLVDLYKALDYANAEELAANAWLEINAPELLYVNDPRIKQVIDARKQSSAAKPPNISINFKDLPPAGQEQAAKLAGMEIPADGIIAYNETLDKKELGKKAIENEIQRSAKEESNSQ